jgi:hypothetical protein
VAALALILVFAAFANAALMVAPVVGWRDQLVRQLGMASATPLTTAFFIASLIFVPAIAVAGSVLAGRTLARLTVPLRQIVARFALALIPLGLTMWMAHLAYHLTTGLGSFWPALQRASSAIGIRLGESLAPTVLSMANLHSVLVTQILLLDAGLLLTLYLGWRLARDYAPKFLMSLRLLSPWAAVAVTLYCTGVWIFLQPMQMRGM